MFDRGTNPNQVALTFDDGPSQWTLPLLEILNRYSVKATFFLLGKYARKNKHLVEAIMDEGHEIGNHSENHLCLGDQTEDVVRREIQTAEDVLGKQLLFRPPYGRLAPTPVEKIAASMGYRTVLWTVLAGDWIPQSPEYIANAICGGLRPGVGNIALLHDGGMTAEADRWPTLESVKLILERLENKQFVTVSQMQV